MSGSNASDAKDLYSSFNLGTISIGTRPLRIIEHDNPDNERIVGVTYYAFNDEVGEILLTNLFLICFWNYTE